MRLVAYLCVLLLALAARGGLAADGAGQGGPQASRGTPIGVAVSGVVAEVLVSDGQRVNAGQLLLALDPRPFELKLAAARATVARLLPLRDERRRELERAEELYDRTVLSDVELQQARNAADAAEARYEEAVQLAALAELDLEYSRVRAPFAGTVRDLAVGPGSVVVSRCESAVVLRLVP